MNPCLQAGNVQRCYVETLVSSWIVHKGITQTSDEFAKFSYPYQYEKINLDNGSNNGFHMADFKRGRKSQSQKKSSESRTRMKSQRIATKREKVTHSTGFAFFEPAFALKKPYQIGLFKFQPVIPIIQTQGVADAFSNQSDYGKYAPFVLNLMAELTTCERDWEHIMIDEERFTDLESEDRRKLILKFSSDIILLLRIRGLTNFTTPFDITGSTFQDLKSKSKTVELRVRSAQSLIEFMPSPNPNPRLPGDEDFKWIEENCYVINRLNQDGRMNFIHDIYDTLNFPNMSVQLMSIWAGIESIILSETPGTRKSIKSRCAIILEDEVEKQKSTFNRIGELYDFRCEVIHGKKNFDMLSHIGDFDLSTEIPKIVGENTKKLYESYQLLTELLLKVVARGKFWTREELRELQKGFSV